MSVTEHNCWLIKTDVDEYSSSDFEKERICEWEGIRNYQARNFIRKMRIGDLVFLYHSKSKNPGIYSLGRVVKESYPDPSQFDRTSRYYDPGSNPKNPRWYTVQIEFVKKLAIPSDMINFALKNNHFFQRQKRLTILPLTSVEAELLLTGLEQNEASNQK
ncbi:MAG: EVE domain-containing protein [Deltaproteobacteria bacterium]|nr:EVE domain-containing protein [Deltaproteobacteria bacterium]